MNSNIGQLVGPFNAKQELMGLIKNQFNLKNSYISHIGVQANMGDIIVINQKQIEIGKTGIFETDNVSINSIYFLHKTGNNAYIDFVLFGN